jgi:hypothetical protein
MTTMMRERSALEESMPAKKRKTAAKPQQAKRVSDAEAANVKGGLTISGGVGGFGTGGTTKLEPPPSCKESVDSGMMGCVG